MGVAGLASPGHRRPGHQPWAAWGGGRSFGTDSPGESGAGDDLVSLEGFPSGHHEGFELFISV